MFQVYRDIPDPFNSMVKPNNPQQPIPHHVHWTGQPWRLRGGCGSVATHLFSPIHFVEPSEVAVVTSIYLHGMSMTGTSTLRMATNHGKVLMFSSYHAINESYPTQLQK